MVQRIDRHISTVAFSPIQATLCNNVTKVSKGAMASVVNHKLLSDDGFLRSFSRSTAAGASPGPGLNELSRIAVRNFGEASDQIAASGREKVKLFDWVRRQIFAATTDATYGPHNPFRQSKNEQAWWDFEPNIMTLLSGVFPKLLARGGLKAQATLTSALRSYYQNKRYLDASLFLQLRQKHNDAFGLDLDDSVSIEMTQVIAGIVNTAPCAFWMIWQVFSNATVLEDCRKEIAQLVTTRPDGVRSFDLALVRTNCPVLVSTWQEVLRFHGITVSARLIQEDTMVDGQYLLKKGGVVMMPNTVIHTDESLWGPTARQFDHKRFVKTAKGKSHTFPAAAFRAFGGGHVLCPGRHFASTEILTLAALLIARFDMRPASGLWTEPEKHKVLDRATPLLKKDVEVEMIPRTDQKWEFTFSDIESGVNIVAEDLE
ncbi:cytochrome P450 [Xylaria sp. CBS 124048]|nr:cytochrome P450 [Xylaria sp. CBS 124048]